MFWYFKYDISDDRQIDEKDLATLISAVVFVIMWLFRFDQYVIFYSSMMLSVKLIEQRRLHWGA